MNSRTISALLALAVFIPAFAAPPEGKGKPDELPAQAAGPGVGQGEAAKTPGLKRAAEVPQGKRSPGKAEFEKVRLRIRELGAELRAELAKAGPGERDKVRQEWLERHKAELEDYSAKARKAGIKGPVEESRGGEEARLEPGAQSDAPDGRVKVLLPPNAGGGSVLPAVPVDDAK